MRRRPLWRRPALPRSLSARLYAIVAVALVAVELLAAAAIHYAETSSQAARSLHGDTLAAMMRAAETERTVERHRRIVESAPALTERERIEPARARLARLEARLAQLLAENPEEHTRRIEAALPRLARGGANVLALAGHGAAGNASAATSDYAAVADAMQAVVREWRAQRFAEAETAVAGLMHNGQLLLGWVFATACVALILIGPVSVLLLRSVVGRLNAITAAMLRLARNDTAVDVPLADTNDELGDMARAVGVFKQNAVALLDNGARLVEVNGWLDIALNNMTRGLSMFDAAGRLVLANASYRRMYDLPEELVRQGTPAHVIFERRRALTTAIEVVGGAGEALARPHDLAEFVARGRPMTVVQRFADRRVISVAFQPLVEGGWVAVHQDVTRERQAEERIARLARHDTLTGLVNRRVFHEELARLAAASDHPGFALMCIDLDRFKEVNDTLGHPVGDALLQAVAERLAGVTRKTDIVARLGGDEFAVIETDARAPAEAEALAQRILSALGAPFALGLETVSVGASIGIALAEGGQTLAAEQLLSQADLALYQAKADGRGVARIFDPALRQRIDTRRALEQDLRRALANGEFAMVYQPILSLVRGTICGCEALIRWRHPVRGLVSPAEFIPLAESIGLIGDIGNWALQTACGAATAWPETVAVAVNLSPAQFQQRNVAADVVAALASSGLSPRRLELEVTESLLLTDSAETVATLHRLRALGVAIALDDFGTGYASLSYLKSFPFDKLKIDQTFVRDLTSRTASVAIVQAVTNLAHSLDMRAVAEGVETVEHLERVRAAGCDELQGYLFSRPVSETEILRVIGELNVRPPRVA